MRNNSMEISSDSHSESSMSHHNGSFIERHPHTSSLPPLLPTPQTQNNLNFTSFFVVPQLVEHYTKILILNLAPGSDVIQSILDFASRGHLSFTILSASGIIASVTLHNAAAPMVHGPFTLLSLTGSYMYNNHCTIHPRSFGIKLSTSQGHVVGGPIGGRVIAGDNVKVLVSTFSNPKFYVYVPEFRDIANN